MTNLDYRELPEEREDEWDEMVSYGFSIEDGPPDQEAPDDEEGEDDGDDEDELGEKRGVFAGDDLLAVCRQYFWPATVRGEDVTVGGLSAVASPPENRRQGAVAHMVAESLAEYRDRGCEFAALWPFDRAFYARYGYATANAFGTLECPVGKLSFAEEYDGGEFRRIDPDDWETVDAVYREHSAGQSLSLERSEQFWRDRVFDSHRGDPYVYCYERDGDPAGYLKYDVTEEDDETVLWATDLAWTDDEAFLNLLRFVYYHDSQVDAVRLRSAPGDAVRDVLDLIPSPDFEAVEYKTWQGLMVRVVDVERALSAIRYPECLEDRIRIAVSDDTAEWNDDTFLLEVAGGEGTCEPADPGAEADVEVSIGTLSQAAVGYRGVERLQRTGELEANEDDRERLTALFPEREVFLRDFF